MRRYICLISLSPYYGYVASCDIMGKSGKGAVSEERVIESIEDAISGMRCYGCSSVR